VVIGDHDQTTATEAASVTKAVAAILPHELYDKQNYTNDIALLRLISPVNFADNIKPACLPPAGKHSTPLFWPRGKTDCLVKFLQECWTLPAGWARSPAGAERPRRAKAPTAS
jgi:Trypsin